jgi:ubiquinone biosynthesis UbiH/UbiF/VisC/COQ6 family hydroxylase
MKYDLIVIGAGPAGLSFANSLSNSGLNIAVLEKQNEQKSASPAYDGREIALTHLSQKILAHLGVWDKIKDNQVSLIKHAKVNNGGSPYSLHFDCKEAKEQTLGYMVSNHNLKKALFDTVSDCSNIHLQFEQDIIGIRSDNKSAKIYLSSNEALEAPLIVAADSRFSTTRKQMGIKTSMIDFARTCIVFKVKHEKSNNETAYECFFYDKTLAALPLKNNNLSIVITIDTDKRNEILELPIKQLEEELARLTNDRYGEIKVISELYSYPLVATFADSFYSRRFALIGDAAVGMHPVTAHGYNLGLRGADTLSKEIQRSRYIGTDYGSNYVLKKYNDKHKSICLPLYHGTNALVRLYTSNTKKARLARKALLRLGNHIKPAKRIILNQLTDKNVA